MKRSHSQFDHDRRGVILLVVLSALTFFSILVAAYLVYSSQSRQSSFALAGRSTRAPDVNWMMNEALMTIVRGTGDSNNPFFGEDLLSDYYGHDFVSLEVQRFANATDNLREPKFGGNGFVRFPVVPTGGRPLSLPALDDVYAGTLFTFTEGSLQNQTYRVLRSVYKPGGAGVTAYDDLYIDLKEGVLGSTTPTAGAVRSLFYDDPADIGVTNGRGFPIHLNGAPRNSRGVGFGLSGTTYDVSGTTATLARQPADPNAAIGGGNPAVGYSLPLALQPNHLGRNVDKSEILTAGGDFDEDYDAADFNNWFLSHRRRDGTIIPSYHRPAVLNFILNQTNWSGASRAEYNNLMASFARATFRPLPIAAEQLRDTGLAINERFTGGSNEYALRTALPISIPGTNRPGLLDQLAKALITGQLDVDNDGDGTADSIWVDLGLPVFTSREGKLIRPLVAPMIEDLSSRLNLNAVGNPQLDPSVAGLNSSQALWAGTLGAFGSAANRETVFRGLGWGPAEIMLPMTSNSGLISNATIRTDLLAILNDRYRFGEQALATPDVPGRSDRDALDLLRFGYRPPIHRSVLGFGYSTDPFGRGGIALGRSGHMVTAGSGIAISGPTPRINEAVNNPYESDPTGGLSGDRAFSLADLEVILRSNDFDSELLPAPLRQRLQLLIDSYPEFARSFTTISSSDDSPANAFRAGSTPYLSLMRLVRRINSLAPGTISQAEWRELIAPELRLGRKLDVNRPFGNQIDDTPAGMAGYRVIDEPGEVATETETFGRFNASVGTIPTDFRTITPQYKFDSLAPIAVTGRQLLARHLYVLMMALSRDLDNPTNSVDFPSVASPAPPSFNAVAGLYKAKRLAQWAVNVVDYRDPDSIMTRFVFDLDPFDANGWSPPTDTLATPASSNRVVWGVEEPQLLFSESLASHDVRLRDTDRDTGEDETKSHPTMPDNDSDQVRMPQGSLFLELYCPHPVIAGDQQTKPGVPQELYNSIPATGASELDLARNAPAPAGGGVGAPVWRIAITRRHDSFSPNPTLDPERVRRDVPDSASFQIDRPDELETAVGVLQYDRFIWFRDFANADGNLGQVTAAFNQIDNLITSNNITDMQANEVFFAPNFNGDATTNSDRLLEPGQFLVLAPRLETRFGSKRFPVGAPEPGPGAVPGVPSDQRLEIFPTEGLIQARQDNIRVTPPLAAAGTSFTPALPMVIAAPRPAGWAIGDPARPTFAKNMVGLNVSEPLPRGGSYYPQPTRRYNGTTDQDGDGNEDYPLTDGYIDYSDPASNARDRPLDVSLGRIPPVGLEPYLGTIPRYCSAFLQRLADPTLAYHPITNPYRTVDWIPIDLSVFTGEDRPAGVSTDNGYAQRSRQRNGRVKPYGQPSIAANALYSYETSFDEAAGSSLNTTADDFFRFTTSGGHLQSSFSFLNTDTPNINSAFNGFSPSIGSMGSPAVTGNDRNLPRTPYAVHPWLNRPFASHLELMMVPACSQGRLFEEFSFRPATDPAIYPASGLPIVASEFNAPFRHLLNFFHSSTTATAGAEFVRLFDYVHTMPRFRGEVDLINPRRLTGLPPEFASLRSSPSNLLSPPFNLLYDNKRQATVNLNTLSEFPVWAGLMQGHLNAAEFSSRSGVVGSADQLSFNRLILNRRGYTTSVTPPQTISAGRPYNYNPTNLDPRFPTEFAGVFRSATTAPKAMKLPPYTTVPASPPTDDTFLLQRRPVNGTLLRGFGTLNGNDPPSGTPTRTSLFTRAGSQLPLSASDPQHDRFRSPFMKYQTLMRMPNLVSDNSQVFVIRLTLGFFEVDANTMSLQKEYNADISQNKRYQATFVIDRSIPVGFDPGQDMNARDVVIFESYAQ